MPNEPTAPPPSVSTLSARLLGWLDWWRPRRPLTTAEQFLHRGIVGYSLLGLFVAVYSVAQSLAVGHRFGALVLGGYGLFSASLLIAAKLGASPLALGWTGLSLSAAFQGVLCLTGRDVHLDQMFWLITLPLTARALIGPVESTAEGSRPGHALWVGTALALGVGLSSLALRAAGVYLGAVRPPIPPLIAATEFLLFLGTVAGLLWLDAFFVRKTEEELRFLRNLLSVCAWCRRVRNEDGAWLQPADWLARHGQREITHGMCPDCLAREFPTEPA